MNQSNDISTGIVQVKNGRIRIETGGMKLIGILHGQFGKGVKILGQPGPFHVVHALGHHRLAAVFQKGTGPDRVLHARGRTRVFLLRIGDQNDGANFGPVFDGRHGLGQGILPIVFGRPLSPGDKTTVQGPARTARTLSGNGTELMIKGFLGLIQFRQGGHECGVTRRGRCQSSGGGKGIVRRYVNLPLLPFGFGNHHRSCFTVHLVRCQGLDAIDAGAKSFAVLGSFLQLAIQP
mmetsp:Transcript_1587/g.4348  ORF Transcript_1587/g.4348 Transcript_1587/m.4348 type:complete len:235 (+) Transcript_1587:812-1516(+)